MSFLPPIELINNVALLLALAVLYDMTLSNRQSRRLLARLLYGVVIGVVGVLVMSTAWPVAPGIVFDTRSILLSVAGLFFGIVPTVVACFITAAFRLFRGGDGALVGILVIVTSGMWGLGWRYVRRGHRKSVGWGQFFLFGIAVHLTLLLSMLLLPYPTSIKVLSAIAVPTLILYPVGTVLLALILQRQRERELARTTIREREERLQMALNAAGMSTWDWDMANNRIVWDADGPNRFEKTGETYQEAILHIHPADRQAVKAAVAHAIDSKQVYQQDFRVITRDGEVRWTAAYGRVVGDPRDDKHRFIGIARDITEQRQSESALRLSRFAIDNAAEGMVVVAKDGRLVDVNREECRRLGYSRQEMLQKYVWDKDPALNKEGWAAHWQKIKNNGQLQFETTNVSRSGRVILLEIMASYIEFEGEEYYFAFTRDITRQRNVENQLLQAQKMEAIGRLAGSIAHDFNNLTVPIVGFADLAMMRAANDPRLLQYLTQIKDSANRAATLTRQILSFSRKEAAKLEAVNVNQMIDSFGEMLPSLIQGNIEVTLNLEPEPLWVEADPPKLEQVLLNLVVNARDAMPNGGSLTISSERIQLEDPLQTGFIQLKPGNHVLLSVADTGEGMSADTMQHIFEPFYTTKEMGKGTGFGLATVHNIVQQFKGDIVVSSEVGVGSVFRVALPQIQGVETSNKEGRQ